MRPKALCLHTQNNIYETFYFYDITKINTYIYKGQFTKRYIEQLHVKETVCQNKRQSPFPAAPSHIAIYIPPAWPRIQLCIGYCLHDAPLLGSLVLDCLSRGQFTISNFKWI